MIIDLDDQIPRLDAGPRGGGIVDRRDDLDEAVLLPHFQPQTAELAGGGVLQALEGLGFEVGRVRIKPFEHAADGIFQQGGVVHLLHIGGPDPLQHLGEGPQLVQGQRRRRFPLLSQRRCTGQGHKQSDSDG